jgi:hypothetical protein
VYDVTTWRLKGMVFQGFQIEKFIAAAFQGIDQRAYAVIWRDFTPDVERFRIIYESPNLNYNKVLQPDAAFSYMTKVCVVV